MHVSHETIYNAIYAHPKGELRKALIDCLRRPVESYSPSHPKRCGARMELSLLKIMETLETSDVDWLLSVAVTETVMPDKLLIREGATAGDLFIVDDGLLAVCLEPVIGLAKPHELARLGAGDVVGDLSLLDDSPAAASVRALESSVVLRIPRARLLQHLSQDDGFASRFHQGIGRLNRQRLREALKFIARLASSRAELVEENDDARVVLERLDDLKNELIDLDRLLVARGEGAELFAAERNAVVQSFGDWARLFDAAIRSELPEHVREQLGALAQRELLPYLAMTFAAERTYSKPRGYAGDYYTIELIYQNNPAGTGRLGALVDECFHRLPASNAVRNRRPLMAEEIARILASVPVPAHVLSMACGPAKEVQDFLRHHPGAALHFTGLDIDHEALEFVDAWAREDGRTANVTTLHGNLLHIAMGRQTLGLPPQHLIYSIGLIDYFNDKFVIKLLDWVHAQLASGGRVVLGNFHSRNPTRGLMDHVLDWRLIHRDETDMNRLFQSSRFGRAATRIVFEDEGINMFAECQKD